MTNEAKYRDRIIRLGLNIAYYRRYRGLTQEELAERTNLSREFIGHIEAPDIFKGLSFKTLFKIADALEIEPYKILKLGDDD